MVYTVAKFDLVLMAILCLEGWATQWLLPLGASPTGIRLQRVGRFLLPLPALLFLSVLFLPPSVNPVTISKEYVVVALTPVFIGLAVFEAVVMVRALRQRLGMSRTRRQPHRQRQGML